MSIDQRYPPEFNSNLPLILTINDSTTIDIYFTAVRQYTSSIIFTIVRDPSSANFNPQTALFYWQNPSSNGNDTIVRVTAQDTKYYLLSTYKLVIHIINVNHSSLPLPSHSKTDKSPLISDFIHKVDPSEVWKTSKGLVFIGLSFRVIAILLKF
jgi:hypothetical protein